MINCSRYTHIITPMASDYFPGVSSLVTITDFWTLPILWYSEKNMFQKQDVSILR
jgi:hypothetical protein